MAYLPRLHTDDETRWWVTHVLVPGHDLRVLQDGGGVVGFAAVRDGWLEHLYVAPGAQGRGHGTRLLRHVLARADDELLLHVFLRNTAARRFYERHGFQLVSTDDGSANEEHEPDATYRWVRPEPPRDGALGPDRSRSGHPGGVGPPLTGGRRRGDDR